MRFTPGPWGYDVDDRVVVGELKDIAHMDANTSDFDAWLIVAAPELYKELLYAIEVAEHKMVLGETWLDRAKIVIAKINNGGKDG